MLMEYNVAIFSLIIAEKESYIEHSRTSRPHEIFTLNWIWEKFADSAFIIDETMIFLKKFKPSCDDWMFSGGSNCACSKSNMIISFNTRIHLDVVMKVSGCIEHLNIAVNV